MPTTPATTAELRAAFEAFAWAGITLEQALADPLRSRLLHARVADMRGRAWRATHSRQRQLARRVNPSTGHWVTTTHAGPYTEAHDLFGADTQAPPHP